MGDMADLAMDQSFDAWCDETDREFDEDGTEHDDSFWMPRSKKTKTCRFCGTKGLSWVETKYGWRLFDKKELHTCMEHKKGLKQNDHKGNRSDFLKGSNL